MARVTALLVLALVAAACGTDSAPTTTAPPATEVTTTTEALPDLASCMTDEGIEVGPLSYTDEGRALLDRTFLGDNDLADPALKDALDTCIDRLRDVGVRLRIGYGPSVLEEIVEQLTAYAICMRENGVDGWPDPVPDFDGSQIPFPLAAMTVGLADGDFGEANDRCEPLVVFSVF
jgi:hypothetical protein